MDIIVFQQSFKASNIIANGVSRHSAGARITETNGTSFENSFIWWEKQNHWPIAALMPTPHHLARERALCVLFWAATEKAN